MVDLNRIYIIVGVIVLFCFNSCQNDEKSVIDDLSFELLGIRSSMVSFELESQREGKAYFEIDGKDGQVHIKGNLKLRKGNYKV